MAQSKIADGGLIGVLLLIAAGLIALAGPRLYAHGQTISAEHILWSVDQGDLARNAPQVERARVAFSQAGTVGVDSGYFSIREGNSVFTQLNSTDASQVPEALDALRTTYTAALAQRPMYARAWPRLALVSLHQAENPEELHRFFEASYIIGPEDYRLRVMRVWLGLRMWDSLDEALQRKVRKDVQALWQPRLKKDLAELYFHGSFEHRVLIRSLMKSEGDAKDVARLTQRLLDEGYF
ncbi:MAG: hypothetical protein P1U50_03335 [Parvibaculaceae bacterium]|nr:hypothetical protein [Parvibaculaceae bacterium]